MKPFVNKQNWEKINFPSGKDDWKKYWKYVLYAKKVRIYFAYVSKHNPNHEKQVALLIIPNGEIRLRSKT